MASSYSNDRTTKNATSRPVTTKSRPRTSNTTTSYGYFGNEIICAISESRGISPSVGLTFLNLSTAEAVLCQFTDTQTYVRTCHKLKVFGPTELLFASTAANSKLLSIIRENVEGEIDELTLTEIDRRYWSETRGHEYLQQLALPQDMEGLKVSLTGKYFAICCFAAALRFLDLGLDQTFAAHTLKIKFESSEGAMMIDLSTIANLELIQNLQDAHSKHCLYGLLGQTRTKMGARLLKSNILQPSTDKEKLEHRWQAVHELSTREALFHPLRDELKQFVDTDRALANIVIVPKNVDFHYMEQSVNHVLMLKSFVDSIKPIWQHLSGVASHDLQAIRELCSSENYFEAQQLIDYALSPDASYSQRAAGTNGFLDVARQSYSEFVQDAKDLVAELQGKTQPKDSKICTNNGTDDHGIPLELKYDTARQFYITIKHSDLPQDATLPDVFVNVYKKGKAIQCQTLDLIKYNQKIKDAHNEIIAMSDSSIQALIDSLRTKIHALYKISEALALLDVLLAFAHLVATNEYVRPEVATDAFALVSSRHPMRSVIQKEQFIPNDIYISHQHKRFQIITGCNMSGKSTYIRTAALTTIMAQVGSFVPAEYAAIPIVDQLFARVATDDCLEANVSTFASEMREMAFVLGNITPQTLVIVDELGRGTSTTDGLAIAIAIAEALIQSGAYVLFVTHFRDLPRILAERVGVYTLHTGVDVSPDFSEMKMRYRVSEGQEQQKYYGLALAQLVNLPEEVMETGVRVSKALNERTQERKDRSHIRALVMAKRRKLAVQLRETLGQAVEGVLEGEELVQRMKRLQDEFFVRMVAIDAELDRVSGTDTVSVEDVAGEDALHTPVEQQFDLENLDIPDAMEAVPDLDVNEDGHAEKTRGNELHAPSASEEVSWPESIMHENPLFRPMPTMEEAENIVQIKREMAADRVMRPDVFQFRPLRVETGDRVEDPIVVEEGIDSSTNYSDSE